MKLSIAIIDQSDLAWDKKIGQDCLEISKWYTNYVSEWYIRPTSSWFDKTIFIDKSLDTVLEKASQQGFDYCLIQFSGYIILYMKYYDCLKDMLNRYKKDPYLFIGEFEKDQIAEQCFIVNLSTWRKLKKPGYKNWLQLYKKKSISIKNLDLSIKVLSLYLFPKDKEKYFLNLPVFHNITSQYKEKVYFSNDEGYHNCQSTLPFLERFYSPGSGLKSNFILELNKFKENAVHLIFDCSTIQLEFRQALLKDWDGEDYPAFCRWYSRYNPKLTFTLKDSDLLPYWESLLKKFNDLSTSFKEHWYKYKKINHKFIEVNICGADQIKLLNCINRNPNSAIWWDNIFHSMPTIFNLDFKGSDISYKNWLNQVYKKNPFIYVLSSNDSKMNPLPAKPLKGLHVPS